MRFGKTYTTYKLSQEMGWNKILVLTFKPAVENSWRDDLYSHVDFEGWQFISRGGTRYDDIDKSRPYVCFASFQDFLGKNELGGIKIKNQWAHLVNWDCIVLDEYHYGSWRDTAKELYESEDSKDLKEEKLNEMENWDESIVPLTTNGFLYLVVLHLEQLNLENSLKNKYSIGHTLMNKRQKKNGKVKITHTNHFQEW